MIDRTKVSFREAEGKPLFPAVLKWGEIDQRVRADLWNALYPIFKAGVTHQGGSRRYSRPLGGILFREHVNRRHLFANEFDAVPYEDELIARWQAFFSKDSYLEIFDFITFLIRDKDCPSKIVETVSQALDKSYSPYRIVGVPPTIVPIVSEEQATMLKADVGAVFDSKFAGAKTHLQAALNGFQDSDHRAVVRESINAVESAVRDFTGDQSAVLSRALRRIIDDGKMHRALGDAFEKLYAYSSDEKGIRHALVFGENEKVGFDEATFFVSACAAFVAFLSRKASSA
jgi:hypothetical protein